MTMHRMGAGVQSVIWLRLGHVGLVARSRGGGFTAENAEGAENYENVATPSLRSTRSVGITPKRLKSLGTTPVSSCE